MASERAQNPGAVGAPRRPNTNRRFDPTGMGQQPVPPRPEREVRPAEPEPVQQELPVEHQRTLPEREVRRAAGQTVRRKRQAASRNGRTPQTAKAGKTVSPGRVVLAAVSGMICSLIVLLTCSGLYGMWCYSHGLPGDINVKASVSMYCLAALIGGLWAGAVVRRRSVIPAVLIALVFMVMSIVVSLQLFEASAVKPGMIVIKLLLTVGAVFGGYVLSALPYLLRRKRR